MLVLNGGTVGIKGTVVRVAVDRKRIGRAAMRRINTLTRTKTRKNSESSSGHCDVDVGACKFDTIDVDTDGR